jgi:putative sigma-54 modulation protein
MKLTTTARHFEANPQLIEHAEQRLIKLKRFFDHILHVDVIMSVENFRNIAEINVHVNGHDFTAKEESKDMILSIDKAAKSLERQMKKFKGKIISNHHHGPKPSGLVEVPEESVIDSGSVGGGGLQVIERIPRNVPAFNVEEAIIKMEDDQMHFILFNDRESGKLNLVYKRPDGNYGVIETRD